MTKEFLDSFKGMDVKKAKQKVKKAKLKFIDIGHNTPMAAVAIKNTVILWVKDKEVVKATAGDPTQIEN